MERRDVKMVQGFPPNFDVIKAALPNANETHTYCYGDTIYVPDGHQLTPDVIFHESIHTTQQGRDPNAWWIQYLTDAAFRLSQEIQAYGEQYKWVREHVRGAKFQKWVLGNMATALSGAAYGNLIGYGEAEARIKNYGR